MIEVKEEALQRDDGTRRFEDKGKEGQREGRALEGLTGYLAKKPPRPRW